MVEVLVEHYRDYQDMPEQQSQPDDARAIELLDRACEQGNAEAIAKRAEMNLPDYQALSLQAKKMREDALENLCGTPEINPLRGAIPFFRAKDEHKLSMINNSNILFNINRFVGRDSAVYCAAEDEMDSLPMPLEEAKLSDYKEALAIIVASHKASVKNTVSDEQAVNEGAGCVIS